MAAEDAMTQADIDSIVIASPCAVPWESMSGDEVRRFCGQCRLHVYDLSQMTRPQIHALFATTGGNFCKRVWRRPDGRVITRDCHRVVLAMRRRLRVVGAAVAGLLALVGLFGCGERSASTGTKEQEATPTTPTASDVEKIPSPEPAVTMGR
jgi:hypothetical protein